jgi:hypothetical protein
MKFSSTILRLPVLLLSLLIIDGGHTYFLLHSNLHPIVIHKNSCDLEIPNHDRYEKLAEEDSWLKSDDHTLISSYSISGYISYIPVYNSQDFSKSVWQPPRFI